VEALNGRVNLSESSRGVVERISGLPPVRVLFPAPFAPAMSVKTGGSLRGSWRAGMMLPRCPVRCLRLETLAVLCQLCSRAFRRPSSEFESIPLHIYSATRLICEAHDWAAVWSTSGQRVVHTKCSAGMSMHPVRVRMFPASIETVRRASSGGMVGAGEMLSGRAPLSAFPVMYSREFYRVES